MDKFLRPILPPRSFNQLNETADSFWGFIIVDLETPGNQIINSTATFFQDNAKIEILLVTPIGMKD